MATETSLKVRLLNASKTHAEWTSADPVLKKGEIAYSSDKKQIRIGDGSSKWSQLSYIDASHIVGLSNSGSTITYTKADGSTGTITLPEYDVATSTTPGLAKSGGDITVASDGAVTVNKSTALKTDKATAAGDRPVWTSWIGDNTKAAYDTDFTYDSTTNTLKVKKIDGVELTGIPTAPTATAGTKTKQIATTEFVQNAVGNGVDDIEIGGRNLVKDSYSPIPYGVAPNQYYYKFWYLYELPYAVNDKFIASADINVIAGNVTSVTFYLYNTTDGGCSNTCTGEIVNGRASTTITVTKAATKDLMLLIYCGLAGATKDNNITVSKVKLERGNKPTDWTPAPEDLVSDITLSGSTLSYKNPIGTQLGSYTLTKSTVGLGNVDNTSDANKPISTATQTALDQITNSIGNAKLFTGVCSTAAGTAEKDVTCTPFKAADLVKGTRISVYFENTNSAAVANLKLDVNNTGAKPIKYIYNGSYSNIGNAGWLKANQIYTFTYDGTNWIVEMMYNSNTAPDYLTYRNYTYAKKAITAESLIVGDADGYEEVASGVVFDLSFPILWCTVAVAKGGSDYAHQFTQFYDRNIGNIKSGFTSSAKKMIYLIVTISGNTATVDADIITDTLPTSDDGKAYIALGRMGSQSTGADYFNFQAVHPIFVFRKGALRSYSGSADVVNGHTVEKDVPSNAKFTDSNVLQKLYSSNYNLPLLMSYQSNTNTTTDVTNYVFRNNSIYANPSTGLVTASYLQSNHYIQAGNQVYNVASAVSTVNIDEIILYTGIKFISSNLMPKVHITGYAYNHFCPIDLTIVFYIYNNKFINQGVVDNGGWHPDVYLFKYTKDSVNYVAIALRPGSFIYCPTVSADIINEVFGKLANIDLSQFNFQFIAKDAESVIPEPDDGTICINVPYKVNRNPKPTLTIQGAGTNIKTYDGTEAITVNITKSSIGLGNVENKSSATIRGELTTKDVTDALEYTPVNKAGDTMTGRLKWKDNNALPQATSLSYVLGIDAFADGGTTKWITTANLSVGSATNATNAANADKLGSVTAANYRRLDTTQFYGSQVMSKYYDARATETQTGGWAYSPIVICKADKSTVLSRWGVLGAGKTFSYAYIGMEEYNGNNLRIYPSGAIWANGITSAGTITSGGNIKINAKAHAITILDSTNTETGLIADNGNNLWIGATSSEQHHHSGTSGNTFISTGYNTTNSKGNNTIYVSIPNATNNGHTAYGVLHAGNYDDYSPMIAGDRSYLYNNISSSQYVGGSGAKKYVRITLPDDVANIWGMYYIEVSIRGHYQTHRGGKVLINCYHTATSPYTWSMKATTVGDLISTGDYAVKVYGSDGKYIYIYLNSTFANASVDRILVGDTASTKNLKTITVDFVDALPETYQTATMHYTVDSGNISSLLNDIYVNRTGDTMTGGLTFPSDASSGWNDKGVLFGAGSRISEYTNGSLGIYGATSVTIRPNSATAADTTHGIKITTDGLLPAATTSTYPLGSSTARWSSVWADEINIRKIQKPEGGVRIVFCKDNIAAGGQTFVDDNTKTLTTSSSLEEWMKVLLREICKEYSGDPHTGIFKGKINPSSTATYEVYIYDTTIINSTTGLPQYSFGLFQRYGHVLYMFGTNAYAFHAYTVLNDGNYGNYASPKAGSTSLSQLAATIKLGSGDAATIDQNGGQYRQRIEIIDNSTANDAVFKFSQSSNSGSSYTNLMEIRDDGNVVATTFTGDLVGDVTGNVSGTAGSLSTTGTITTDLASTTAATYTSGGNITPGITGTLGVGHGGTGATSFTAYRMLVGNGSNAIQASDWAASQMIAIPNVTSNDAGWIRVCQIGGTGSTGYWNCLLFLSGQWSNAQPTSAVFLLNCMHSTWSSIHQLSGRAGGSGHVIKLRLVNVASNTSTYWLDVYTNAHTKAPGITYLKFFGNVSISEIQNNRTIITENPTVSSSCDIRTMVDAPDISIVSASGDAINSDATVVKYNGTNTELMLPGKISADITGNVTGDVTGHASEDLPLTGGTITGNLTVDGVITAGSSTQSKLPTGGYKVHDLRSVTVTPDMGDKTANFYFTSHNTSYNTMPASQWWSVLHIKGWEGAYSTWELAGPASNTDQRTTPLYVRTSNKNTAWGAWRKIYDTSNPPTVAEIGIVNTPTSKDFNTYYDTGFYNVTGSATHTPKSYGYGAAMVMSYRKHEGNTTPDWAAQIYMHHGSGTNAPGNVLYYRTGSSTAWNAWQQAAHGDVNTAVGSISQPIYMDKDGTLKETQLKSSDIEPIASKTYSGLYGSANDAAGASFYFATVKPDNYYGVWKIKYRIKADVVGNNNFHSYSDVEIYGKTNTYVAYLNFNSHLSTDYRCYCYHNLYRATEAGSSAYGHLLGIGLRTSKEPISSSYPRTIKVDILEAENCTVTMMDDALKYASVPGTGTTNYAGLTEFDAFTNGLVGSKNDANDTYTVRDYYTRLTAGTNGMKQYSLVMQDASGKWQSFTTDAGTGTSKTKNTVGFQLGKIYYLATSGNIASGSACGDNIVTSHAVNLNFQYSSNCGTTLSAYKPLYIKGTYNHANGLFYLADTWWTQDLPTSEDGFVYKQIGYARTTSNYEFANTLPTYWYKDGAIREFIPEATTTVGGLLSAEDKTKLSNFKVTTTANMGVTVATNAIGYIAGQTKADWNYQQTDGALYTQYYNASWQHQIFGDYRTGHLSVRGKSNGTWQSWHRVLDEAGGTLNGNLHVVNSQIIVKDTYLNPTASVNIQYNNISMTKSSIMFDTASDMTLISNVKGTTPYPLIRNHNNGNISVSASSGILHLGYENTTGINFLNGRANFQSNGTLHITPATNEGGEIHLNASVANAAQGGIGLDQYYNTLRVFGLPSADGTTKTGNGSILTISPYEGIIEGAYDVDINNAKLKGRYMIGTAGTDGYIKIARLVVSYAHSNRPIEIAYSRRGDRSIRRIIIQFEDVNNTDPNVRYFQEETIDGDISAYLYKAATSTWDLYVYKNGGWGSVNVIYVYSPDNVQHISVTLDGSQVDVLPNGGSLVDMYTDRIQRRRTINGTDYYYDIGMNSSGTFYISHNNELILYHAWDNSNKKTFYVSSDKAYLPSNSYVGSTAITSDKRLKKDFATYDSRYEDFFMSLKPSLFKMIDGDSNRYHTGFVAQEIEDALTENGLTTLDFAGLVIDDNPRVKECLEKLNYNPFEDTNTQYYLRYNEFVSLNTHMIQKNVKRLLDHEDRITQLEEENKELKEKITILEQQLKGV